MRGLILAVQFLTRLPTPQVRDFKPEDLSRSAIWFPAVGAIVGFAVIVALAAGALVDPWIGALAGLLVWTWITGALHLDGLGDLADALGASHRDTARFLEVLKDPRKGTFGVVAIALALASKLVLLGYLAAVGIEQAGAGILLACAWARVGPLAWSITLPALGGGSGERFAWSIRRPTVWGWIAVLTTASALLAPVLLVAPLALLAFGAWLKRRVGGQTGDCLGAGVEVIEIVLAAALAIGGWAIAVA